MTAKQPTVQSLIDQLVDDLVAVVTRELVQQLEQIKIQPWTPVAAKRSFAPPPTEQPAKIVRPRRKSTAPRAKTVAPVESSPIEPPTESPPEAPPAPEIVNDPPPTAPVSSTPAVRAPKRFWLPKSDPVAMMSTAIAWLAANTHQGDIAILVTGSASLAAPKTTIGRALGPEVARSLQRGEPVAFGAGHLLLVPKRRLPRGWTGGPALVAWARSDLLEFCDYLENVTAILAVPWAADTEVTPWATRHNARALDS